MSSDSEIIESTFIVVGGGISGVSCVERLSYLCPDESILLLSTSSVVKTIANLSQMTKLLSTFDVVEKSVNEFAEEHSTIKVLSAHIASVDASKHELLTSDGRRFRYRYLCLCHGARPKVIDASNPFILGIRDTESVQHFQERLSGSRRIAVVGNGGIATEIVHELKGVDIFWAIKDDSVNAAFVDAGAGQFFIDEMTKEKSEEDLQDRPVKRAKYVARHLPGNSQSSISGGALGPDWHEGLDVRGVSSEKKRVRVEFEVEVKRVWTKDELANDDDSAKKVLNEDLSPIAKVDDELKWNVYLELTNGKLIGFDFVVSATGVVPNGDMIKIVGDGQTKLSLSSDGAIKVNQQMETNLPDVYAAGDVCFADWGSHSKHWFQMRLWTQARQMGLYAAHCLSTSHQSNGEERHTLDFCFEMFTHVTKFFGFKVILLGLFNGQGLGSDYEVLLRTTRGKEYVKVVMHGGRMQGAILIGETDLEETFENLILNQMDLSEFGVDLLDPNIDIEDFFD